MVFICVLPKFVKRQPMAVLETEGCQQTTSSEFDC